MRRLIKPFNEQLTDFIAGKHPKDTPLYVGMTQLAISVTIDEMRKRFPNEFIGKSQTRDYSNIPVLLYGATLEEKRLKHDFAKSIAEHAMYTLFFKVHNKPLFCH